MKLIQLLIIVISLSSFQSYGAKKHCAKLLTKFHNIQAQQRQGSSLKKSKQLRKKEDLARERWWNCESSRSKPKVKSTKKKLKSSKNQSKKKTIKLYPSNKKADIPRVFTSKSIVIKSKFKGNKQAQWLNFYKRPAKCAKPKTTQVFAYCMEDKTTQQQVFEQKY